MPSEIGTWNGISIKLDDTLPPGYVKFLMGGKAFVFCLGVGETRPVAEWQEDCE